MSANSTPEVINCAEAAAEVCLLCGGSGENVEVVVEESKRHVAQSRRVQLPVPNEHEDGFAAYLYVRGRMHSATGA